MPWLGVYVGKIPAATGNLSILLNRCIECATARVQKGSEKKDLFHYLVRPFHPSLTPSPHALAHLRPPTDTNRSHSHQHRTKKTYQTRPRRRCSS